MASEERFGQLLDEFDRLHDQLADYVNQERPHCNGCVYELTEQLQQTRTQLWASCCCIHHFINHLLDVGDVARNLLKRLPVLENHAHSCALASAAEAAP
jgi:hypothetical protein